MLKASLTVRKKCNFSKDKEEKNKENTDRNAI